MSSWGALDNVLIAGTVTTSNASSIVAGFNATAFLTETKPGDYIIIDSNKYQIDKITSNTELYLTSTAATISDNVNAYIQQGPKYLSNVDYPANNYSIQNVYGVDRNEIGINLGANATLYTNSTSHSGWVHAYQYTDAFGNTRVKTEVLVAMSKNFNANATGVLQVDADDDANYPDA